MNICCQHLRKLDFPLSNSFKVILLYPKIIFIETSWIKIISILQSDEKHCIEDHSYELESQILDYFLEEHYLWLALQSGELLVINGLTGKHCKIRIENFAHYKICQIKTSGTKIFLLSESGECLNSPFSVLELDKKLANGAEQIIVTLDKPNISMNNLESYSDKKYYDGLNITIDNGIILAKCPITGLIEEVTCSENINYVVPWSDKVIIANRSKMCVTELEIMNIHFEFDQINGSYSPLGTYNSIFYYVALDKDEVFISGAWEAAKLEYGNGLNSNIPNSAFQQKSSQESLKNKLNSMLACIESEAKSTDTLEKLQNYFEKIEDLHFLVDVSLKLCRKQPSYKILLHPLQKRVFSTCDQNLLFLLKDILIKIDILQYVKFRSIDYYDTRDLFDKKIKELIITFLSKSDLDIASICWLKYSVFKLSMNCNDVLEILLAIPENIKLGSLIHWLRNFAPTLLDDNPYYIDIFVKWTTERVFGLEQSAYWPKIGIKFLDEITNVLETSLKTIPIRPISMDDLDSLKSHLNYIIELKEKHKINMLLAELSSQSPNEVALIMLKRCYTEDLEGFLQDYLPMYASRYIFELDDTLCSFIENEAACGGGNIDGVRLKILLQALRNHTTKLECFLQVLKLLDVPWDHAVSEIATTFVASTAKDFTVSRADTILAQDIQKEMNYAKVKIVLKKYNIPWASYDVMLVLQKLINSAIVDINDLKIIISASPTYANYGHLLYLNRCLIDCETRTALYYFNNLKLNEKKIVLKTVVSKYEQIINNEIINPVLERNFLDFLKGTRLLNEFEIKSLERLYYFKKSSMTKISLNQLHKESMSENLSMEEIARTQYSREFKLMKILKSCSNSHEVRKITEDLIISKKAEPNLSVFDDGKNFAILLESCDVLIQLVLFSAEEDLHSLIKYLSVLTSIINTNVVMKNLATIWKYNYVFLPLHSVTAANDFIAFCKAQPKEFNALKNFGNRCDLIPLRVISYLLYDTPDSPSDVWAEECDVLESTCRRILSKISSSQEFDEILTTSLLIILRKFNPNQDITWTIDALKSQNDSFSPAVIKYFSSIITRRTFPLDNVLPGGTSSVPPQFILKSKFDIDLDIAFSDASDETWDVKVILFYVLKQYPNTSFDRLTELCRTLSITLSDGLTLQLISLLTSWELKYKLHYDDIGNRHLHLEVDESDLISKCILIWESIENKDFLKEILSDFWRVGEITLHGRIVSINPYYYEVFLCIHRLIFSSTVESRNVKEYFLLHFLKNYKRKSTPKQYEFELFSVKGIFPEIGYYRLPFHLFMRDDMWSNLKSEITLETYERWLPAGALLGLDANSQTTRDMICSNAVKQTMTSRKQTYEINIECRETEHWRLTSKEEPLLRAAHRCVKHIANMEWAGACLFHVLQGCARGADQVAAAQLCYQFSQKWATVQPGNRAVRQMERLHLSLSTRHALHKVDWACEELVRLAPEPAQLIRAMYLHPDFVRKISRHDVNRAANEIADKNGINISSIRIQILENILEKSIKDNKYTDMPYLDPKDLVTSKYILRATCPKMGAIYLSRIAFDEDIDFNKSKKLRALQCLMSVVDTDTAIKVANRERDALWTTLVELLYIVNLEKIDLPWIVATFAQDKERAVEQLLHNVAGNVDTLKIAAEISCRYGNVKIIRDLLPLILRTSLYEEMIPMLLKVSMLTDETICLAWRAVILSPFQRSDYPMTERQRSKCLNVINLLPVCPVIRDEDLVEIWKNCIRCKNLGLGCLVLPYMTAQTRQTLSELQKVDRRNLIASLKNLHNETYLVAGAMYVIESMAIRSYR